MARSLPKKNNPHILPPETPSYDELLRCRRLGKTNLSVRPTVIGTSNATKPENLGPFEYAHLRVKLPKDLKGSEIFPSHNPSQQPETYFLMRRSKDGYVSATGMFKIAFPWAKLDEERTEREYVKARKETSEDEIAGNVWISPLLALELAKEYQMYDWVRALLDPTEIVQTPSSTKKHMHITPPPRFDLPPVDAAPQLVAPTRLRRGRSASPSKKPNSPRKPRTTRSAKDPKEIQETKEASIVATSEANANLQSALDATAEFGSVNGTIQPSVEKDEDKVVVSPKKSAPTPRPTRTGTKTARKEPKGAKEAKEVKETNEAKEVEVEETVKVDVQANGDEAKDVERTKTTVAVELPILPEAPSAEDTQQMIAQAKEMVEASKAQDTEEPVVSSPKAAKKRKPEEALSEDEEDEETKALRTKRVKVLEERLKVERVRNRALISVTVAFAFAASIPYFF